MKLSNVNPAAHLYAQAIKMVIFLAFSAFMFWNYVFTKNAFDNIGEISSPKYIGILAIYIGSMVIHFTLNLLTVIRAISRFSKRLK